MMRGVRDGKEILQTHFFVIRSAESLINLFIFGEGVGDIKCQRNGTKINMPYLHSFKHINLF